MLHHLMVRSKVLGTGSDQISTHTTKKTFGVWMCVEGMADRKRVTGGTGEQKHGERILGALQKARTSAGEAGLSPSASYVLTGNLCSVMAKAHSFPSSTNPKQPRNRNNSNIHQLTLGKQNIVCSQ